MKLKAGDTIILATHNPGKLREITQALSPCGLSIDSAGNLGLADPEETEATFAGNALLKARHVVNQTGQIALADDSGLVVPSLDGLPGIHSARWGGPTRNHNIANAKVHTLLAAKPREAYFICVLAVVFPNGDACTFEGRCDGRLTWPTRGEMGFGYDGMFIPEGETRTFAEMTGAEKSTISHRTKAFELFKESLFANV